MAEILYRLYRIAGYGTIIWWAHLQVRWRSIKNFVRNMDDYDRLTATETDQTNIASERVTVETTHRDVICVSEFV